MYKTEIERTLESGRKIVCYTRNGNAVSSSGATVMLIEVGHDRAGCVKYQTGVINKIETTCYRGNVGWSAKKEKSLLSVKVG